MPGIIDLYAVHAEDHIENHVKAGTKEMISRKQVELEILDGLDKNKFPIEMKISWYNAILSTPIFETLWRSAAVRHKLTAASTSRYQPKESLYEIPSSDEVSFDFGVSFGGGPSPRRRKRSQKKKTTPTKKRATTGLKTIPMPSQSTSFVTGNENDVVDDDDDDDDDNDSSSSSTSSTRAYAAALVTDSFAQETASSFAPENMDPSHLDPHLVIDPSGLARQDVGDGDYGKRGRPRQRGGNTGRANGADSKAKKGSSAKGKGKGKGKEVRFAL